MCVINESQLLYVPSDDFVARTAILFVFNIALTIELNAVSFNTDLTML